MPSHRARVARVRVADGAEHDEGGVGGHQHVAEEKGGLLRGRGEGGVRIKGGVRGGIRVGVRGRARVRPSASACACARACMNPNMPERSK